MIHNDTYTISHMPLTFPIKPTIQIHSYSVVDMHVLYNNHTWFSSVFMDDDQISDIISCAGMDQLTDHVVAPVHPLTIGKHQTQFLSNNPSRLLDTEE